LSAVRSRKQSELHAEILETHQSTALCHIGNISWRLGKASSTAEIQAQLGKLPTQHEALDTFDRTRQHMVDNEIDLEKSKFTLGPLLALDSDHEKFQGNAAADALLTREYRKPFVVPTTV